MNALTLAVGMSANRLGGSSLIELLVYGRIVGEAAASYSAGLKAQQRSSTAEAEAGGEIDQVLGAVGREHVRPLQRPLRDLMTEHAGVVRDEAGLRLGLSKLEDIEARSAEVGVHPDLAGFQDLAHAFDLRSSIVAARATLEAALERRETAAATIVPITRPSIGRSRSIWLGPVLGAWRGRRSLPSPTTLPR